MIEVFICTSDALLFHFRNTQAGGAAGRSCLLDERYLRPVGREHRRGQNGVAVAGRAALGVGGVVLPINRRHAAGSAAGGRSGIQLVVGDDGRLGSSTREACGVHYEIVGAIRVPMGSKEYFAGYWPAPTVAPEPRSMLQSLFSVSAGFSPGLPGTGLGPLSPMPCRPMAAP